MIAGSPAPTREELSARTMRSGADLMEEGRKLASVWRLGQSRFMQETGFPSEAAYKRHAIGHGVITQHAHIGFRSIERTLAAMREVRDACAAGGVSVDRFGITLDWSMGYPVDRRADAGRGTGIVLSGPDDFARITDATGAACHFGDFMLGLPGALDNVKAAIAAGATALGNLGQYFTFRLPYWDDDVATTEATVTALGLIAAQDAEILVHSNLDDGFAGLFLDMCCSLGMVIVEKHIVETLIGSRLSHCYGHHFSDPLSRMAFHSGLSRLSDSVGTMIFGNTVSYQSSDAANFASLSNYLMADILSLRRWPSGHAINPVPVTENRRIPDTDEIIAAQEFAGRLKEHAHFYEAVVDWQTVETLSDRLVDGARQFAENLLAGLENLGIDTTDPAALMLAIRRLGPRRIEALFGPGAQRLGRDRRSVLVQTEWARELDDKAGYWVAANQVGNEGFERLKVCVGTSDVHEHGKYLVEQALAGLGVQIADGGVAVDPEMLVERAVSQGADLIAISTYNGLALRYTKSVLDAVKARGLSIPVMVGGRLNEIPADSNSGLPVEVIDDINRIGATACASLDDMLPLLRSTMLGRSARMPDATS
jgi:methylmalonyl-CoA mutase cobalamin-binding subunit